MSSPSKIVEPTIPVAEIFGPTIQGEGMSQGIPVHFLRTGGCDYKCVWCDTPHAVLPEEVRKLERLPVSVIDAKIANLPAGPKWLVISGGNPMMHRAMQTIIDGHHARGGKVMIETQGTIWRDWALEVDEVCLSPKPPSSGMTTDFDQLDFWVKQRSFGVDQGRRWYIKVVVFDDEDYFRAKQIHQRYRGVPFFVSAGNDAGRTVGQPDRQDDRILVEVQDDLIVSYKNLVQKVMHDPEMQNVRVQAQMHVIAWGNQLGV